MALGGGEGVGEVEEEHEGAEAECGRQPAPPVTNAPPEMQAELLDMQLLSVDELLRVAHSQMEPEKRQRHVLLLQKNSVGDLQAEELAELDALRLAADRLMLRKAYAWAVLRWRGHPTPALEQLPLG